MSPTMLAALAALTAVTAVLAVAQLAGDLFLRDRARVHERIDDEFLRKRTERAKQTPLFKNLGQAAAAALADEEHPTPRQRFAAMVEQSGIDTTPERVLTTAVVAALGLALLGLLVRRSPLDAGLAALAGAIAPVAWVRRARDARIEKLRSQLADAFDLMARVVRAGQTLSQALLAVADEFPPPIATELACCYEQQNLGLSPEATYQDLTRRTGLLELKIFVLAVLVQQQTGGNLSEILSKLAGLIRERYQIRGTIRTLTAEGRMQGYILAGLPPLMLLLLLILNHDYAMKHFEKPLVLAMTFAFEGLGLLWIRRIVNFDY